MKKKMSMVFLLMGLVSFSALCQVQHVGGVTSIDITSGVTRYGNIYSGSYVRYFSNKFYGKAQLFYEMGQQKETGLKYSSSGLDVYVAYTFKNFNEVLYLNAIGGATVSSDNQTAGQANLGFTIPSTLKYGVLGGAELELFISRKLVFITNFSQKLLVNGNFGSTRWIAQAGLRYNF